MSLLGASLLLLLRSGASVVASELVCHGISDIVNDQWCNENCNGHPPNCPEELCECESPSPPPTPTPGPPLERHAYIGYWGSAAQLPTLEQLPEALRRGYNVISVAFGDLIQSDGSFQIHTNMGPPPTKESIGSAAGFGASQWEYLLSFGGQNAAGPAVPDIEEFVSGFVSGVRDARLKYGFDGIDIDIETGMTTPLLKALRKVFAQLHSEGFVISMAPQPLNIDPDEVGVILDGSYNCYVPLVDKETIGYVSYVAPQLYNNPMPLNSLEEYIRSMQRDAAFDWEGEKLVVNIPSSKLVFGYPAAPGAAPSGPSQPWEADPAELAAHYQASETLMATGGAMTWSIGWDATNGWDWITNVKKIWDDKSNMVLP